MIEITVFLALTLFYFYVNRYYPLEASTFVAVVFMALYFTVYLAVPPKPELTSRHLGLAFGYVPLVSYAVILFPQFNEHLPSQFTRFLGWFGMIFVFIALGALKLFVW